MVERKNFYLMEFFFIFMNFIGFRNVNFIGFRNEILEEFFWFFNINRLIVLFLYFLKGKKIFESCFMDL